MSMMYSVLLSPQPTMSPGWRLLLDFHPPNPSHPPVLTGDLLGGDFIPEKANPDPSVDILNVVNELPYSLEEIGNVFSGRVWKQSQESCHGGYVLEQVQWVGIR